MTTSWRISILATSFVLVQTLVADAQSTGASDASLELPGADQPYPFTATDIAVEDALRMFSRNLRIGLRIEEDFDLSDRGDYSFNVNRFEFLEELAAIYDFGWYFDGSILHIFEVGQMETKVYSMQQTNGTELISILKSLGIYQDRFMHRTDDRRNAVLVVGPASYIEAVDHAVDALETAEKRDVVVLRGSTMGESQTTVSGSGSGSGSGS